MGFNSKWKRRKTILQRLCKLDLWLAYRLKIYSVEKNKNEQGYIIQTILWNINHTGICIISNPSSNLEEVKKEFLEEVKKEYFKKHPSEGEDLIYEVLEDLIWDNFTSEKIENITKGISKIQNFEYFLEELNKIKSNKVIDINLKSIQIKGHI